MSGPTREPIGRAWAEAADVLRQAQRWELPTAQWTEVEALLTALQEAIESGDPAALSAATAGLELLGPWRLTPIRADGDADASRGTDRPSAPGGGAVRATEPIRERMNTLIHRIGSGGGTR